MAKARKKSDPRFVAASSKGRKKSHVRVTGTAVAHVMVTEGKNARQAVPREEHHTKGRLPGSRDPVQLVLASNKDRVPGLVPVRHSRMLESPFTFYRGTAAIQAHDLPHAPSSGIEVQCCGDAHLMNFGGYASPERQFLFDLNDFDETFPAPFEWDLKRLAASMVLAARWRSMSEDTAGDIAEATARAYRERIGESARQATLDTWYDAVTWEGIQDQVADEPNVLKDVKRLIAKAQDGPAESVFHRLTPTAGDEPRLLDQPPLLYHLPDIDLAEVAKPFLDSYAKSLREDVRSLFSRLRF